jgi:RNA 2',3'-cyclic 3'-phosphodiesterase
MSERVRAFMAMLLPVPLKAAATQRQEQLRVIFPVGSVRWVGSENFHLTVRFFGDLDRKALSKATGVVESLEGEIPAIPVRLGPVSAFPSPSRPQTVWVAVDSEEGRLDALAALIDRRIREAGFGPADKPWRSHLTLGRVNREGVVRPPAGWSGGLTGDAGDSTIGTIALMQSELRPQGPRYTPLRTVSASPPVS